jgi:hypothetical protein
MTTAGPELGCGLAAGGLLCEVLTGGLPPEVEPELGVVLVPGVELTPGVDVLVLAAAGGFPPVLDAAARIGEALKLLDPPQPTIASIMMKNENVNSP